MVIITRKITLDIIHSSIQENIIAVKEETTTSNITRSNNTVGWTFHVQVIDTQQLLSDVDENSRPNIFILTKIPSQQQIHQQSTIN